MFGQGTNSTAPKTDQPLFGGFQSSVQKQGGFGGLSSGSGFGKNFNNEPTRSFTPSVSSTVTPSSTGTGGINPFASDKAAILAKDAQKNSSASNMNPNAVSFVPKTTSGFSGLSSRDSKQEKSRSVPVDEDRDQIAFGSNPFDQEKAAFQSSSSKPKFREPVNPFAKDAEKMKKKEQEQTLPPREQYHEQQYNPDEEEYYDPEYYEEGEYPEEDYQYSQKIYEENKSKPDARALLGNRSKARAAHCTLHNHMVPCPSK